MARTSKANEYLALIIAREAFGHASNLSEREARLVQALVERWMRDLQRLKGEQ